MRQLGSQVLLQCTWDLYSLAASFNFPRSMIQAQTCAAPCYKTTTLYTTAPCTYIPHSICAPINLTLCTTLIKPGQKVKEHDQTKTTTTLEVMFFYYIPAFSNILPHMLTFPHELESKNKNFCYTKMHVPHAGVHITYNFMVFDFQSWNKI